jgi:hypothetical protein
MILRRVALIAAGLAMATGVGLAGVTTASAATPHAKQNITPGNWTLFVTGAGCEVDSFTSSGTFSTTEFGGDAGNWAGGGSAIALAWTAGSDTGLLFSGTYIKSSNSFRGKFGGFGFGLSGKLVQGARAGC